MKRIILSGCNGRMGRAVADLCRDGKSVNIVAGLDTNTARLDTFPVYADPKKLSGSADCVVDFSHSSALESLLDYCVRKKMPIVLCATGYSDEQSSAIEAASKNIPIFQSANMSYGVHVIKDLAARAAALLGNTFDIEIIERHHNQKLDAPSGTAFLLADAANNALGGTMRYVTDRSPTRTKRERDEIGLHALRGGTITGEHSIVFAGPDEVVELKHSALSRDVFASGALKAAEFIKGKPPGLYSMGDLIEATLPT
jgi:4-hydroxy-tetrahydrodipicolinate reductase